jgi:hypothetical protein
MAHNRRGHATDRAGARDQHILAQDGECQRRVDGIAERVEDGGDLRVDPGPVVPDVRHRQGDQLGERPGAIDADTLRVGAQLPAPGHAVAAAAADHVALAAHEVAGVEVADVVSDGNDLAHELVADDERHRDRALRPGVPAVDVHVGAADSGAVHADQDVVDAVLRLGHVLQPQASFRPALHKCAHRDASYRPAVR